MTKKVVACDKTFGFRSVGQTCRIKRLGHFDLGHWNLEFICDLVLVIWDLTNPITKEEER